MRFARRTILGLAVCAAGALAGPSTTTYAATTCDKVAGAGTAYPRIGDMLRALGAGQTGCVRGTVTGEAWIAAPGATLTSEPGQQGTIVGEVTVDKEADGVTVSDLVIDGSREQYPTPTIHGDNARFERNDVSNGRTNICFQVGPGGNHGGGTVRGAVIADNRIHDCGTSNNHRHGVYVADAVGTRIVGNAIYDVGDRGIQLYPNAQSTVVAGNVVDGNGEGITISGARGTATSGSRVHHNVFSNPRVRASVESYWEQGSPVGRDNLVSDNCISGGRGIDDHQGGFTARDNVDADPQYANRRAKDFRMPAGSVCGRLVAEGRRGAGLAAAPATAARRRSAPRQRTGRAARKRRRTTRSTRPRARARAARSAGSSR